MDQLSLLDVNVLLALVTPNHIHHKSATEHLLELKGSWATCGVTEAGFLRLLLTPAVMGREVSGPEALGLLESLRGVRGWQWIDAVAPLASSKVEWGVLSSRNQVTDLQLIEIASMHGARLCTYDAKMLRFLAPNDADLVEVWQ